MRVAPGNAIWTCYCCDNQRSENGDLPNRCPKCGGIWVRPLSLTRWQDLKWRIRTRFDRPRTFSSADELIEWLSDGERRG